MWELIAGLESRPHHLPTGRPLSGPRFLRLGNGSDDLHRVILLGGGYVCTQKEIGKVFVVFVVVYQVPCWP